MNEQIILSFVCANKALEFLVTYRKKDGFYQVIKIKGMSAINQYKNEYSSTTNLINIPIDIINHEKYYCPWCNNKKFVKCGKCSRLICWEGENNIFYCTDSCGNQDYPKGKMETIEATQESSNILISQSKNKALQHQKSKKLTAQKRLNYKRGF